MSSLRLLICEHRQVTVFIRLDIYFDGSPQREKGRLTSKQRRRAIEEKESQRWLESLEKTHSLVPAQTQVITVADREADIYELFALARPENSEFLIRAAQNRNTKLNAFDEEIVPLFEAIRKTPLCSEFSLELQRTPRRAARSATLSVRVTKLWLQPPAHLASLSLPQIEVYVILAQEENPPSGEKAVSWLLLTTLEVADFEKGRSIKINVQPYKNGYLSVLTN